MTEPSTHRGFRCGLALLIATSVAVSATPVFSQAVPVPKPAPKTRDGGVQLSAQDKAPVTTGTTQAPPNPVIPDRAAMSPPMFSRPSTPTRKRRPPR